MRNPTPVPTETVKLDNGRWVERTNYRTIVAAVDAFIPSMRHGHSYTVETIVGQALWRSRLKWIAGPVVAHAVRRDELPLRFAPHGKRATKQYELSS